VLEHQDGLANPKATRFRQSHSTSFHEIRFFERNLFCYDAKLKYSVLQGTFFNIGSVFERCYTSRRHIDKIIHIRYSIERSNYKRLQKMNIVFPFFILSVFTLYLFNCALIFFLFKIYVNILIKMNLLYKTQSKIIICVLFA